MTTPQQQPQVASEPTPTITAVVIAPGATAAQFAMTEPQVVRATFTDTAVKDLFEFYSDELHFEPVEFIGLTERQALELFHRRDVEWLRS